MLFGVLVFQGNAQSETCFKEYTWNGGAGAVTAKVLTPTSDDSSILNKGAAFLLQWKDRDEILGGKVKVVRRQNLLDSAGLNPRDSSVHQLS